MTTLALEAPPLEPMTALLKRETRQEHAEAEKHVPLLGPDAPLAAYRVYLEAMLGFCGPLESALAVVPGLDATLPDWKRRAKSSLLTRDLHHLAAMGCPGESRAASIGSTPRDLAQAFGNLYVVEGATLGGQVIARHVEASLGITPERGGAFLRCYGRDVGPMWKAFGRALDTFAVTPRRRAEVLCSARAAFAAITRLLAGGVGA